MAEISIIVPVYKAEQYLADCIGGILSQTYSDFELLLVDDGSPDNSLAICQDFARRDSRVRVFHQENQGQSAARNFALTQATGNWICYVDSDDFVHVQMLELLFNAAMESGASISMCGSLAGADVPDGFFMAYPQRWAEAKMDEETLLTMLDRDAYPAWVVWGKLIRREIVESYPMAPGRIYEDNEAVCRWVCKAGKLAILDFPLYFYRENPVSTTQVSFNRKKLDYLWALESIIRFYGELGFQQLQLRFVSFYANAAADFYRKCKAQGWKEEAENIRKQAKKMFITHKLPLPKRPFEILLDAFHPKLVAYYWPLEAVYRRLKKLGKGN